VLALIGWDEAGQRSLDSSILIRTADIDRDGRLEIGVGATLVRHSDPHAEVHETRAKVGALLDALTGPGPDPAAVTAESIQRLGADPRIQRALQERNTTLSRFWLDPPDAREDVAAPALAGRRALVIDAEDAFTGMLAHQLRAVGLDVLIRRFDEPFAAEGFDLVVVGPGPGDPRQVDDPKMAALRRITGGLLAGDTPFLSVCLGHQVLCALLGFELVRRPVPNQGLQCEIDLFGSRVMVGFYNTFAAISEADRARCAGVPGEVEVSRNLHSRQVHALRGPGFYSLQFHVESILSQDGVRILERLLLSLLPATSAVP
jgi:phenazine biosynthesis protein phzE